MKRKFKIGNVTVILTEVTSLLLVILIGVTSYKGDITVSDFILFLLLLNISGAISKSKENENPS